MNNRFLQALAEQRKKSELVNPLIAGSLGITLNGQQVVECPDRASFVYVAVRSSDAEVIQAFNDQVAPVFGLPVFIQWQGNRYIVVGRDTMRYSNWQDNSAYLPRHASTHEFRGSAGDVVFVAQEQFLPLMPQPSGSTGARSLLINDYAAMLTTGSFAYVPMQSTQDLVAWNPSTTGAVMVLVMMDALNGNLTYSVGSGSIFSNSLTGTADVLPHIPVVPDISRYLPIAAVRLVSTTTYLSWDNIYDVRPFMGVYRGTVGGGGGGGFTPQGTGTFLAIDASNGPLRGPLVIYQGFQNQFNQYFDYSTLVSYLSGTNQANFGAAGEFVNWSTGSRAYGIYIDDEGSGLAMLIGANQAKDQGSAFEIDHFMDNNFVGRYFNPTVYITRSGNRHSSFIGSVIQINQDESANDDKAAQIEGQVNFSTYYELFPNHTGTPWSNIYPFPTFGAPYFYDTNNQLPTGTTHTYWNHFDEAEMWLTPDGRLALNQLMVRENAVAFSTEHPSGSFSQGQVSLVGGTATIHTTAVTMSSRIYLTTQFGSGSHVGYNYVYSRMAGSGFTIRSSDLLDTSLVAWLLVEPV